MRIVKNFSRVLLVVASILHILVNVYTYLDIVNGLIPYFSGTGYIYAIYELLPGLGTNLLFMLIADICGVINLAYLFYALPSIILLIGLFFMDRSKIVYRLTVYPVLIASILVFYLLGVGALAIVAAVWLVLAILADILPES